MSNEPTTTETITYPKPTPQTPPALVKKIGKTTYRVWAHFSTTSTETMEDKIKRLLPRKYGRQWRTSNRGTARVIVFALAPLLSLKSKDICGNMNIQKAGDRFGHSRAKAAERFREAAQFQTDG